MKISSYIYKGLLAILLLGWSGLMTSCSDHTDIDQDHLDEQGGLPLHVASMTRGDEDPVSDSDPMSGKTVRLFLKQFGANDTQQGELTYSGKNTNSDVTFGASSLRVKPGKDYLVFGFMPSVVAGSDFTVNVNDNAVTMKINDLSSISTEDVCVVIGVKGKLAANEKVVAGSFKYHAPEDTEEGYGVSLLVDHLYAAADLKFLVDPDYAALRTIKLLTVKLKTARTKKLNATIQMTMNETGANPMTANPVYEDSGNNQEEEIVLFRSANADGDELSATTPFYIPGYFAPNYGTDLKIESTYVVYDKKGNLLPSPDDAENHKLRYAVNNLSTVLTGMTRGLKKTVNMTIKPTYLYILSDDDLNNPTIVVGTE